MAKVAKKKQTDYTKGGHEISQTAIPLYQTNLGRIDTYLSDPQARQEKYLKDYYENNTATSDFLRNYNKAMSDQTAYNYGATTGGYSTVGDRNYMDQQRYQNDLAARLRDQGVTSAYGMAVQDYQNMLAANNAYQNAYGLGKEYSDIDQYNYMADQQNSFGSQAAGVGGGLLKAAGAVASVFNPALGMGLMAAGNGLGSFQTQMPSTASTSTTGVGAQQGMFGDANQLASLQRAISQQGLWGQNRKTP